MNFSYKKITPDEFSLLKDLLKVFSEAFEDPESYQSAVPRDDYLIRLLKKDHFITLVALDGRKVIGGITAYILEKFEQERKEIYLYDLAVAEQYRRQGVARGLINKLKEIAKEQNAIVFVQADVEDIPAIKLYESMGNKADVYHFDIHRDE